MKKCVVCEQTKHEEFMYFTTAEKIGGTAVGLKVDVCEDCMASIEAMEEETN